MRVALDLNPLAIHKGRGIGFYTQRLEKALTKKDSPKGTVLFEIAKFTNKPPKTVDLIHYPGFTLFTKPKTTPSTPFVVTVHDLIPLEYPDHFPLGIKGKLTWTLQKRWLKKASAIITDSKTSKKSIHKHTGISNQKIHVIYLAADKEFTTLNDQIRLKEIQKRYQLPNKFILYVGDLNWNKNIPRLAQTCIDLKYPLVLVGNKALEKNYDKSHLENKDLTIFQSLATSNPDQILRLGFVPTKDLVAIYNLAAIYAQPSISEGFGLPILEAFSCGCPVITSKNTSTEEISGKAALLINPSSQEELSKALKSLWIKQALREKLSKLGLKQVQKFTWGKTKEKTLKVYEKVLKNS